MDDALFDTHFVAAARHRLDPSSLEPALARVEAALADNGCRVVLVTGVPGAGKTSLLALLADRHPGWPRYFIRDETAHDGSLQSFLIAIGRQCAQLWPPPAALPRVVIKVCSDVENVAEAGVVMSGMIGSTVRDPFALPGDGVDLEVTTSAGIVTGRHDGLMTARLLAPADYPPAALAEFALFEPASRVPAGGKVVVLLDGVGALPQSGEDVLGWLIDSARPPANVRFVVSAREDEPRLATLHVGHAGTLRTVEL